MQDKTKNNLLLNFQVRNKNFNIFIINDLTCEYWGKFWGDITNIFCNDNVMKDIKNVTVNLEKCLYADPMALMSVLLEL